MINTPEKRKQLRLDQIEIDQEVQPRVDCDDEVILDYAEAMRGGAKFPELVVFESDGHYLLADGHYRLAAMHRLDPRPETVKCTVLLGDKRSASLWAAGANAEHGAQRTNKDKRRSVLRLLNDPHWSRWTDRRIARHCGVSNNFVSELRRKHLSSDDRCGDEKREGRDGKSYKQPKREVQPKLSPKAPVAVEVASAAASVPKGKSQHPSEGDYRKNERATLPAGQQKPRSKVQLFKELHAVLNPMIDQWSSRAEFARALREIADNLETALVE